VQEGLRFFLPFWFALLTGVLILVLALLEHQRGKQLLLALFLSAGLFGVLLLRQWVVWLQQLQVRREREAERATAQALRETNRQIEAFLAIASHELKTPLTTTRLGLERLHRLVQRLKHSLSAGTPVTVPQVEVLHTLVETTLQHERRLHRLMSELLDLSRIQEGRFELCLQPADLAAIVLSGVEEQRQEVPERTILCSEGIERPVPVLADAERLGQVVTNYLSNALRYSEEASPVEVGVQVEGEQGRVWVRDEGPGIPLCEQGRLWERFYRVPGIVVQSGSGIGLGIGLYLCKTIIEQYGGQVGVESAPGRGSTFWFTLPLPSPSEEGRSGHD
jgi:signal transduction histidine kinase